MTLISKDEGQNKFSKESDLGRSLSSAIKEFWQSGEFGQLQTFDGYRLEYCAFINPLFSRSIVISPGRVEGYLKYQELIYDLFHQEYNVFVIDHRGQGLSQRLVDDEQRGYVDEFDNYAHDLRQFIADVVIPKAGFKPQILAHSMGGAIAIRLLQLYPEAATAMVLCSPMIAINTGAIPRPIAVLLIRFMHAVNKLCSNTPWYFFNQSDYQEKSFKNNHLMHSKSRYEAFRELYQQNTKLQLGGVTLKWLLEAEKARIALTTDIKKITVPFVILQASEEVIVDNNAQNEFCLLAHRLNPKTSENSLPIRVKNARHEILFESDSIRNYALQKALNFFQSNERPKD